MYNKTIPLYPTPQERSLPDVLNAIGESFRCGTMPEGEFPMEGLDLEHTVDEFIDAFSSNMAVCTEQLIRWLKALRRCALRVVTSLVKYFQSGREVILHSQELADYLTPAYYAPDYLDLDGMTELMDLLHEADNLEQCLDVEEQRRFFHEYNHQLERAVRRVHDALMGNMPDRAFAMRRKVARLRSDVQEIIRREEKRWTEGLRIDPYATEEELLREAIDCVEGQLSQSLFYCHGADTLMKVVEHILSLTNERIGAQLDQFLYNYAQLYWLRQRLHNSQCTIHNSQSNINSQSNQPIHMEVHITNQEGGIIQYTDKPICNFFGEAKDAVKIYQDIIDGDNTTSTRAASEADVLLKYCPNREQCSTIAAMLRGCTRASQLVTGLLNIDSKGWIEWNEMNTTDFRSDILPLLGYETTEELIKKSMARKN